MRIDEFFFSSIIHIDIKNEQKKEQCVYRMNEINDFLTANSKSTSTENVLLFIEKYSKELENSANLETLLYGLYRFAEMKGYREGMSAGRDIGAGRAIPPSSIKK